ncbi:FKBP-type peptidyl-prolyl cis-trans isomerase [Patescibacteria group bacterium]|nr:FKBP-type peptidyl-prolyl cis-trans isomerase [Patescibacteria group bacterium]
MNVTATGIAVAAAVIVAIGLLFFGPQIFAPFTSKNPSLTASSTSTTTVMQDTNSVSATGAVAGVPGTPNATSTTSQIPQNVTQLMVADKTVGTGAVAKAGDKVTVQYVGMLTDGSVFDASANHGSQGFTFTLGAGQVIKGWDEGVAGMKVGGKRELIIPASLGYGAQATGPIPANSTLVFDVELVNVQTP